MPIQQDISNPIKTLILASFDYRLNFFFSLLMLLVIVF